MWGRGEVISLTLVKQISFVNPRGHLSYRYRVSSVLFEAHFALPFNELVPLVRKGTDESRFDECSDLVFEGQGASSRDICIALCILICVHFHVPTEIKPWQ